MSEREINFDNLAPDELRKRLREATVAVAFLHNSVLEADARDALGLGDDKKGFRDGVQQIVWDGVALVEKSKEVPPAPPAAAAPADPADTEAGGRPTRKLRGGLEN